MFTSNFLGGSGGPGGVFSSNLAPVDCKTDRKIDGELLEYGFKFPQMMAANGLRETLKLLINMPESVVLVLVVAVFLEVSIAALPLLLLLKR